MSHTKNDFTNTNRLFQMEAIGQMCCQLCSQNQVCGAAGTILPDMWILFIIASTLSCYNHNYLEKTASKAGTKLLSIVLIDLVIIKS